jgi:hypothetical protein
MGQLISEIWEGLRSAGLAEVMLYLPDESASRCHWDDTTMVGGVRVALIADQDRKIVRILPVDSCTGIGIASPKGTDPSGYRAIVKDKLAQRFGRDGSAEPVTPDPSAEPEAPGPEAAPAPVPAPAHTPPNPPPAHSVPAEPEPVPKPDPLVSRWGMVPKPSPIRYGSPSRPAH